jgi:hypothetical protein
MGLRSMHQEGMTQVHSAGFTRGRDDWTLGAGGKAVSGELSERQPRFSCGRKLPGDVRV